MGPLGFNEILIILVIVLLLFGGKKIPELMQIYRYVRVGRTVLLYVHDLLCLPLLSQY